MRHIQLYILAGIVFLECVCQSISYPVLPGLLRNMVGGDLKTAAAYGSYLALETALLQFLFAPIAGALSDYVGRRVVILAALIGYGVSAFLIATAPSLPWLFVAGAVSGICGSSIVAAYASATEIVTSEQRAASFGLLSGSVTAGVIFGPGVGGALSHFGLRTPFAVAGVLVFVTAVVAYAGFPETLRARQQPTLAKLNPLSSILGVFANTELRRALGSVLFYYFAWGGASYIWPYFTMMRFGWSVQDVSISMIVSAAVMALVQGVVLARIVERLGERIVSILGASLYAVGWLGSALSGNVGTLYFFLVLTSIGGLCDPSLRSVMSRFVASEMQGELQGTITGLRAVLGAIAPLAMAFVFQRFTTASAATSLPGAPLILCAGLALLTTVLFSVTVQGLGTFAPEKRQREKPSREHEGARAAGGR